MRCTVTGDPYTIFGYKGKQVRDNILSDQARIGDHQWYVSDFGTFKADYPNWRLTYGIDDVLKDIYEHNVEQWQAIA